MTQVLDWLLDGENPSVTYFALKSLAEKEEDDPQVQRAKGEIAQKGVVPAVLALQNLDGSFGVADRFYDDKYWGTVWTMLILAEHGAPGEDPQVQAGCEFLLAHSREPKEGGFSARAGAGLGTGLPGVVVPCLTGNMVFTLLRLGYGEDPRVQEAVEWLLRYTRTDDGDGPAPKGALFERREPCYGTHSCHMGVVKSLKALAEIPEDQRSPEVKAKLEETAEYFLKHHIHKKSHHLEEIGKPGWLKLGFPLMYQTDILEILHLLTKLKIRDSRMEEALEILQGKAKEGQWKLENTMNGKTLVPVEQKGKPSRWITLRALETLKGQGIDWRSHVE